MGSRASTRLLAPSWTHRSCSRLGLAPQLPQTITTSSAVRPPRPLWSRIPARAAPFSSPFRHPFSTVSSRHSEQLDLSPDTARQDRTATQSSREKPRKQLTMTCKVCSHRSTHQFSTQAYEHGTVLIACPGCKNRHLIADNLKIFRDERVNLEDLMREKGVVIRKGILPATGTMDGDIEFVSEGNQISVQEGQVIASVAP